MMDAIQRHFYNFLSMAFALVDHVREYKRRTYGDKDFGIDIQNQIVDRFADDDDHIVVQGVRDFVLHYRVTPFKTQWFWMGGKTQLAFGIPVEGLFVRDDQWTQRAVEALKNFGDEIDIRVFVNRYCEVDPVFFGQVVK